MRKIILSIILLFPFIVRAECTNQELTRYKTLAGNINSYYDYNASSNTFTAIIENVHSDLYVFDKTNNNEYHTSNSGLNDITISNLVPGKVVTVNLFPSNGDCRGYSAYTLYVTIPHYNQYYSDSVCVNNNNSLCSKWANTSSLTYDQFVEAVNNTTEEKIEEEKEREEYVKEYGFFDFLADYYIFILLAIILLGSVCIYFLDKKSKFDF